MSRKPPRWVTPFLRALERTGEVEAKRRAKVTHLAARHRQLAV